MQRVRRRRRHLVILMFLALLIPAGVALLYLNLFPIFLKSRVVVKEMTEQFDALDNVRFVFGGNPEQVKVETEADLTKPGGLSDPLYLRETSGECGAAGKGSDASGTVRTLLHHG